MTKKKTQSNSSSIRGGYRENAGRKSSWNHGDTCTIRIPKSFASQLVQLARRLDNGEEIDTDTESKSWKNDFVTKSFLPGVDRLDSPTAQANKAARIDIDTEFNLQDNDSVTESIQLEVDRLDSPTVQANKAVRIDNDTESNCRDDDSVTESIRAIALDIEEVTSVGDKLGDVDTDTESNRWDYAPKTQSISSISNSLTQLAPKPKAEGNCDNDTESIPPGNDNVTESRQVSTHQTLTQSMPDLKEAIALAETIVKAKKSARESIARLLSKLYSTQVSPDDLK